MSKHFGILNYYIERAYKLHYALAEFTLTERDDWLDINAVIVRTDCKNLLGIL
jgi:uncharacterized protein YqgQ